MFVSAYSNIGNISELLTHNLFAYCINNPINMSDPNGNIAWWAIGAAVGGLAGAVVGGYVSYKQKGYVDWKYVAVGAAGGALVGAGLGWVASKVAPVVAPALAPIATTAKSYGQKISQGASKVWTSTKKFFSKTKNVANNAKNSGSNNIVSNQKKCPIAPRKNHSQVSINERRNLSPFGQPNSTTDLLYENGKVKQRRFYGPDGKAEYDIDFTDHGNPSIHPRVHRNNWKWDGNRPMGHDNPITPWLK